MRIMRGRVIKSINGAFGSKGFWSGRVGRRGVREVLRKKGVSGLVERTVNLLYLFIYWFKQNG